MSFSPNGPLRVGIGGPVGSGKTALCEQLCKAMRDSHDLFVITNDIYTKEDQQILTRTGALPAERIEGAKIVFCQVFNYQENGLPGENTRGIETMPDLGCGRGPLGVLLVDLDGDGRDEIVCANNFSNDLTVIRSR